MQQLPVKAYLSLGSNCAEAQTMMSRALAALKALPCIRITAASPLYFTEPQGYADQPWFVNQVLEVLPEPALTATVLLAETAHIETALGRSRSASPALRFGPRVIDVDILLFGTLNSSDPLCTLPHPRMTKRAFVLIPLLDIAPNICINGRPAAELLAGLAYRLEGQRIFQ